MKNKLHFFAAALAVAGLNTGLMASEASAQSRGASAFLSVPAPTEDTSLATSPVDRSGASQSGVTERRESPDFAFLFADNEPQSVSNVANVSSPAGDGVAQQVAPAVIDIHGATDPQSCGRNSNAEYSKSEQDVSALIDRLPTSSDAGRNLTPVLTANLAAGAPQQVREAEFHVEAPTTPTAQSNSLLTAGGAQNTLDKRPNEALRAALRERLHTSLPPYWKTLLLAAFSGVAWAATIASKVIKAKRKQSGKRLVIRNVGDELVVFFAKHGIKVSAVLSLLTAWGVAHNWLDGRACLNELPRVRQKNIFTDGAAWRNGGRRLLRGLFNADSLAKLTLKTDANGDELNAFCTQSCPDLNVMSTEAWLSNAVSIVSPAASDHRLFAKRLNPDMNAKDALNLYADDLVRSAGFVSVLSETHQPVVAL